MTETPVVTVFLRNRSHVLLLRRSDAVGSYPGRWGAVAGHAEGDPDAAARQEIREETGIDPDAATSLRRRGEPFSVADESLGMRWLVHPFLFDCATREVEPNEETSEYEWAAPPAILRRETVPELWTSYDRVRPTVESIAADREHGSADLSVRGLEVLRDVAALAAERAADGWARIARAARDLVAVRPAMPALTARVDRAMAGATDRSAAAVETATAAVIETAQTADDEAAAAVADRLVGCRVATLSRSGTVRRALVRREPESVLVAESRPGAEGAAVASDLAGRLDAAVTLTTDAAFPGLLADRDADCLVVGADAIFADGRVRNKVGTRGAALAATDAGVDVLAVAATAKVTPDESLPTEAGPAEELTDDADLTVENPLFETTPSTLVDAIATERGVLDPASIASIAAEHAERRAWRAE